MEKSSMIHSHLEKGVSVTKGFPGKEDWFLLRLLESAVYWMSIAYIPKGLLHKRRKKLVQFLVDHESYRRNSLRKVL